MCNNIHLLSILLISFSVFVSCSDYYLILTANDPVIQGAEVTFIAKLFSSDGSVPEGRFEFEWDDIALKRHRRKIQTDKPEDKWSVSYPADEYPMGPYDMQVIVNKCYAWSLICIQITSKRIEFSITSKLNGHMNLKQNQTAISGKFVASKRIVTHEVSLNPPDDIYIKNNATSILTYWFVDCVYYGVSSNYSFDFKYDKVDSEHLVEALVVAGFEPLTTPAPPTTTTVKPNTTTTVTTTTKKPTTSTTPKPINATTVKPGSFTMPPLLHHPSLHRRKRDANITSNAVVKDKTNSSVIIAPNVSFPFVCMNKTEVAIDPSKVYGYFSRRMIVKDPITNITVTGNNWLKHGDILQLQVKCSGSPPFTYCINYHSGPYNFTSNETCSKDNELTSDVCDFPIIHYYNYPAEYAIVIVVNNEVTKLASPVTVNVYKVEKQSQLSVIVVPVSFSLVAVVLIVFGIAYYIQNRRRFTVEVANFDFGQQYSDLEYKTFRERLRDSISNAFTKAPKTETPEPTLWPPSRKYGSMT